MESTTIIINAMLVVLFGVSAHFIKKTEACPCSEVDVSRREYILLFSLFEVVYLSSGLILGKSLAGLFLSYPILFMFPILSFIGIIFWSVFTIQYIDALKKCKCPEYMEEEILYYFAVLESILWCVVFLIIIYLCIFLLASKRKKSV